MTLSRRFAAVLSGAACVLGAGVALGQGTFPERPVRLIVTFPPGGWQ